jgi:hypothetical protein
MTRAERLLERKLFLKQKHIEIIRREVADIKAELKKLRAKKSLNRRSK